MEADLNTIVDSLDMYWMNNDRSCPDSSGNSLSAGDLDYDNALDATVASNSWK